MCTRQSEWGLRHVCICSTTETTCIQSEQGSQHLFEFCDARRSSQHVWNYNTNDPALPGGFPYFPGGTRTLVIVVTFNALSVLRHCLSICVSLPSHRPLTARPARTPLLKPAPAWARGCKRTLVIVVTYSCERTLVIVVTFTASHCVFRCLVRCAVFPCACVYRSFRHRLFQHLGPVTCVLNTQPSHRQPLTRVLATCSEQAARPSSPGSSGR